MKVMITGASGQLGVTLADRIDGKHEVIALASSELDISDRLSVGREFIRIAPDVVVNAAAFTAVDLAESEFESASNVNHIGVDNLSRECLRHDCRLIHVSTDFVFSGKQSVPYTVESDCDPQGVYGKTKRDGELAVLSCLPKTGIVIRTAWLYSPFGKNFVKTMLKIMTSRTELNVVCDQLGTPTSTASLADLIVCIINNEDSSGGILHWTDAGVASWYDFAVAIYEESKAIGLLDNDIVINPVPTSEYPTPAKRPFYSVLDKSESYSRYGMPAVHWRIELRKVLLKISQESKGEWS